MAAVKRHANNDFKLKAVTLENMRIEQLRENSTLTNQWWKWRKQEVGLCKVTNRVYKGNSFRPIIWCTLCMKIDLFIDIAPDNPVRRIIQKIR